METRPVLPKNQDKVDQPFLLNLEDFLLLLLFQLIVKQKEVNPFLEVIPDQFISFNALHHAVLKKVQFGDQVFTF